MWDDVKINRLAKEVQKNAFADRAESEALLTTCKTAMTELVSLLQDVPVGIGENAITVQNADTLHKLISAASTALSQMGSANEKLLKLATFLQKFRFKEMDGEVTGPKGQELKGSMFSSLKSMLDKKDDG